MFDQQRPPLNATQPTWVAASAAGDKMLVKKSHAAAHPAVFQGDLLRKGLPTLMSRRLHSGKVSSPSTYRWM
jgi:hypothetical protein